MTRVREGYRQLATQVQETTLGRIELLAAANGRSVAQEVEHALQRHADAPPAVRVVVETPALQPAEVEGKLPKKKPGPRRKK